MQTSVIVMLMCVLSMVVIQVQTAPTQEQTVADNIQDLALDTPVHERSHRNKRGLLLLKKKLILGALGLKAAKAGAAAGVVGALALKAKSKPKSVGTQHTYYHHGW